MERYRKLKAEALAFNAAAQLERALVLFREGPPGDREAEVIERRPLDQMGFREGRVPRVDRLKPPKTLLFDDFSGWTPCTTVRL
jgi:hypothetical protein